MPEGGMVVPRNFRATERDLEQAFEKAYTLYENDNSPQNIRIQDKNKVV